MMLVGTKRRLPGNNTGLRLNPYWLTPLQRGGKAKLSCFGCYTKPLRPDLPYPKQWAEMVTATPDPE